MRCIRKKCFETNSSSTHSLIITKDLYVENSMCYNKKWGLKLVKSEAPIYDFESIRAYMRNEQTIKDPLYTLNLWGGNFGREELRFVSSSYKKANYLVTYIKEYVERKSESDYLYKLIEDSIKKGIPELNVIHFNTPYEDKDVNDSFLYEEDDGHYTDIYLDHDSSEFASLLLKANGLKLKGIGEYSVYEFIFNKSYILISGEDYRGIRDKSELEETPIQISDNEVFVTIASVLNDIDKKEHVTEDGDVDYNIENKEKPEDGSIYDYKLHLGYYDPNKQINALIEK